MVVFWRPLNEVTPEKARKRKTERQKISLGARTKEGRGVGREGREKREGGRKENKNEPGTMVARV